MNETKHTPGPWKIEKSKGPNARPFDRFEIVSIERREMSNVYGIEPAPKRTQIASIRATASKSITAANASLIAAAPETAAERDRLKEISADLLEALDSLLSLGVAEGFGIWEDWEEVKTAREVIAKAKGTDD